MICSIIHFHLIAMPCPLGRRRQVCLPQAAAGGRPSVVQRRRECGAASPQWPIITAISLGCLEGAVRELRSQEPQRGSEGTTIRIAGISHALQLVRSLFSVAYTRFARSAVSPGAAVQTWVPQVSETRRAVDRSPSFDCRRHAAGRRLEMGGCWSGIAALGGGRRALGGGPRGALPSIREQLAAPQQP